MVAVVLMAVFGRAVQQFMIKVPSRRPNQGRAPEARTRKHLQSKMDIAARLQIRPGRSEPEVIRQVLICPTGLPRKNPSSPFGKNIPISFFRNHVSSASSLLRQEGRFGRSSGNAGRDAMDAAARKTTRAARVRQNRVVLIPRRCRAIAYERNPHGIDSSAKGGLSERVRHSRSDSDLFSIRFHRLFTSRSCIPRQVSEETRELPYAIPLPDAGIKRVDDFTRDGGYQARTPGRARISRSPLRRECRDVAAYLW